MVCYCLFALGLFCEMMWLRKAGFYDGNVVT